MKKVLILLIVLVVAFEACDKEAQGNETVKPAVQPLVIQNTPLDSVYDSLSAELCCRVYLSEQSLNAFKKKRWPNSETLIIAPMRAIDPVYCTSKTKNPPN